MALANKSLAAAGLGAALAALAFAAPAHAQAISPNTWYTAAFNYAVPSAIFSPGFETLSNGPLPGGGFQAVANYAPTGSSWTVNVGPGGGFLVVTDVETSGDQFQMFVNGNPALAAPSILGSQQALANGYTSNPVYGAESGVTDIAYALSDPNYSSGTFYLPAGLDTITGLYQGSVGGGDLAFLAAAPAPVPGAGYLGFFALALGAAALKLREHFAR